MISMKLSSALGVIIILITIAFLLSSDGDVASAAKAPAAAPSAIFPADAGTLGILTDHAAGCDATGAAARNVTFTVSGLTGPVSTVEVTNLTFGGPAHTWVGDIEAVLIAPNGASHMIFGRTLATTATSCGDSTDATGPYTFSDAAAAPPNGGWWQTANILGAAVGMTPGSYRSTNIGGAGATIPMPATSMNPSFTGVTNANGTWTLRLSDHGGGDTGAVSAASLSITTAVAADANVDLNGDSRTDYVVARGTNTPLALTSEGSRPGRLNYSSLDQRPAKGSRVPAASAVPDAPPIFWYTQFNNSGATAVQQWGDAATDFITPEDFDGDGKDDLAIWRPVTGGAEFWIFQSMTNTAVGHAFGQDGDDPAVVGDYDGDNKADVAVYRCPPLAGPDGQCHFFYRGTNNNPTGNITYVPWGFGVEGDFFPNVGDFDGDGRHDFCLQRSNPTTPANGQFILLKSSNLSTEFVDWGFSNDFIIPGDYDGDAKSDFCVRRTDINTGVRTFYILYRTGATAAAVWSVAGDASAPGDYDGDGKTDIAIWRGSATPGNTGYWVLNSSNGSASFVPWGQCATPQTCDFAVAGWAVH